MSLDSLGTVSKAGKFFGKLFHSRDVAHLWHLRATTLSEHLSLEGYYKNIIKLTDKLIESYQGCYGIVNDIEITIVTSKVGSIQYFKDLKKNIMLERGVILPEPFLINICDEILAEISSLIYKLENLK